MPVTPCPQCGSNCDESHKFCSICGFHIQPLSARPEDGDPLVGTTLPGGYTILERVGVGGMGRVYRAEQKALGRTVAVKIIHPHLLGDESTSARFITEARAASQLNHPNSVAVIDFGKHGAQLYLVMEFLRGRDLATVLDAGPLPIPRAVDILMQVLDALAEAHHLGIVHRDLKPENIVVEALRSGSDHVKVVDFGLAKMREGGSSKITSQGLVCGTPDYMAPEQGRGDPIDSRADLYSCGVLLYLLLTGRLPFEAESPTQVVLMHLTLAPPAPCAVAPERHIPPALEAVTLKAMSKSAADRYASAEEFSAALRTALPSASEKAAGAASEPVTAHLPTPAALPCTSCSTPVPRGQKFCGNCGAPQLADGSDRGASAPLGEVTLPLPFVGRAEELEWLEASLLELEGGFVSARVVGESGSGKSRLLREFWTLAASRCFCADVGPDPWGAGVGYWTLRQAIQQLAELPEGGGDASQWTDASSDARRGLLEVFDRAARTSPGHGSDRRKGAAEALRWAVQRAAARTGKPVVLMVDDLHAIDGASRNALADVAHEPPPTKGLLVATLSQPHLAAARDEWPDGVLELRGLSAQVASNLLRSEALAALAASATGSVLPYYADQLVRYRVEGGTHPPPRLGDLIALRLERLGREARHLLLTVAICGEGNPRSVVSEIAGDPPRFDETLDTLAELGMVWLADDAVYIGQPALREIALLTAPAEIRRELHLRAFDRSRSLAVEVRAHHAFHAEASFEALSLLDQAAARALARGDSEGAILSLRRGLELARRELFRSELDDPGRAVMMFGRKLGDALARKGQLSDADGVLREALDLAEPDSLDRSQVLGSLALVAVGRKRLAEARTLARAGLAIARRALSHQPAAAELFEQLSHLEQSILLQQAQAPSS